jgi:hypothetical protein
MEHEKKYSAKEAAVAVLKKAEEVLKKSELLKAAPPTRKEAEAGFGVQPVTKIKGVSNAGLEVRAGDNFGAKQEHKETLKEMKRMPKPNLGKAEQDVTPADGVQKDPTDVVPRNVNPDPGAAPVNYTEDYKGHIKLAKFLGHMESKRKSKTVKAE